MHAPIEAIEKGNEHAQGGADIHGGMALLLSLLSSARRLR
jgi:hypothetical protein